MTMSQKTDFLSGEGDKWFNRNKETLKSSKFEDVVFLERYLINQSIRNFLEIGCSNGYKTIQLAKILKSSAYGIDPSEVAISNAKSSSEQILKSNPFSQAITFEVGTADELNFTDSKFDFIYFGFCLYLVDRELINKVVSEADRCLKPGSGLEEGGFLAILDFDPSKPYFNDYKHKAGLKSYKEDYARYFIEKEYRIIAKECYEKNVVGLSINKDERIAITLLQKR
jgi:ubiquinone/menaquinone biosynthesis C-methylase UbiE